jgi:hypothetical protein
MSNGKRLSCFVGALAFLVLGVSPSSIPSEISEFYEDYNFVASFSTPGERDALIECFTSEILPEDIRTNRLSRVFHLMKKLHSRIVHIDPEMVQHVGPRRPYIKYFFRSELFDIQKVDQSGKKAVVEVRAYSVEPAFVHRYIQQYEANPNDEGKVPTVEEYIESLKSPVHLNTEFHIWLFQDGRWMMAEHKNIFIKQ